MKVPFAPCFCIIRWWGGWVRLCSSVIRLNAAYVCDNKLLCILDFFRINVFRLISNVCQYPKLLQAMKKSKGI